MRSRHHPFGPFTNAVIATDGTSALAVVPAVAEPTVDTRLNRLFAATPAWDGYRRSPRAVLLARAAGCRVGDRFDVINENGSTIRGTVSELVTEVRGVHRVGNRPLARIELDEEIYWSDADRHFPLKLAVHDGLGPRGRVAVIQRRRLAPVGAPDLLRLARRNGPYYNIAHLDVARARFEDGSGWRFVHVVPEAAANEAVIDLLPRSGLVTPLTDPPRLVLPLLDVVRVIAVVDLEGDGLVELVTDAGHQTPGGVFEARHFDGRGFVGERRVLLSYAR